ncbi:MAG: DUF5915 domain-containing protein, partial [Prevotellaceae bacterium]|nr:DUF5915 domain-containing protein [Prevotellaceae bacterium]
KGQYTLTLASGDVLLTAEDVEIITEDMPGWMVANEGKLTVALDITVTDELLREGIARELVNRIQNIRKSNGYEITDKIIITIERNGYIDHAVEEYKNYIATQTLADEIDLVEQIENPIELAFDDCMVHVDVRKK